MYAAPKDVLSDLRGWWVGLSPSSWHQKPLSASSCSLFDLPSLFAVIQESPVTFLGEIHHWGIIHSSSFWARSVAGLTPRGVQQHAQGQLLGPVREETAALRSSPGLQGGESEPKGGSCLPRPAPLARVRCSGHPLLAGPSRGNAARGAGRRPVRARGGGGGPRQLWAVLTGTPYCGKPLQICVVLVSSENKLSFKKK